MVGGIIPTSDASWLDEGVAHVFTPKDYKLAEIMAGIVRQIRRANALD